MCVGMKRSATPRGSCPVWTGSSLASTFVPTAVTSSPPPSAHRSGHPYRWLDANCEPTRAPAWLKRQERVYVAPDNVADVDFEGDGSHYVSPSCAMN